MWIVGCGCRLPVSPLTGKCSETRLVEAEIWKGPVTFKKGLNFDLLFGLHIVCVKWQSEKCELGSLNIIYLKHIRDKKKRK